MNRALTCCFTGHRRLPKEKIEHIIKRLDCEVTRLINQGMTDFISGGALGFDQMAAALIIAKKEIGKEIRLIFALPCRNQSGLWNDTQKKLYLDLLSEADEVIYVSEEYSADCMKKRNQYMVDRSTHCICALLNPYTGTGQTVRYAEQKGIVVCNVAE